MFYKLMNQEQYNHSVYVKVTYIIITKRSQATKHISVDV